MWRFFYNVLFPFGFLGFVPGLILKYRNRPGWKSTFGERFGRFTPERRKELAAFQNGIWIHAVSVGETVVALSLVRAALQRHPDWKFVLSTTTTTGQELARQKAPANVAVIFCPIDFLPYVRTALDVVKPRLLAIFETEIWPNMIAEARKKGAEVMLINARMSDHSARGYRRAKCFFGPLLNLFSVISAQSEADAERFRSVSPKANVIVGGNLKFDQHVPENLAGADFSAVFGAEPHTVLLAASTHPNEEALIADAYRTLRQEFPALRLAIVPRHAERGEEIAKLLTERGLTFHRRSLGAHQGAPVDVELADTTGEMLALMKSSSLVIMGKSLAGQDEGHNLIEPALLDKPIVTGAVLRNFRFLLNVLKEADAVRTVAADADLAPVLRQLLANPAECDELGKKAGAAIRRHAGAVDRTIGQMEKLL